MARLQRIYLFPLIGALQGLILRQFGTLIDTLPAFTGTFTFAFMGLMPFLFYFTYREEKPAQGPIFSIVAGGALAGLLAWSSNIITGGAPLAGSNGLDFWHGATVILLAAITLVYFRALRDEGAIEIRYARVFESVSTIILSAALTAVFTGVIWLLLALSWSLFALIGITIFEDIITNDYVAMTLTFAAIGAGLAVTTSQPRILKSTHDLVSGLFRLLAPFVAILLIAFILTLPFTGLTPLWETDAATAILLSLIIAAGLLSNAEIQDGIEATEASANPTALRLVQVQSIVLPVPAAIAAYAVWIRIDQYGLTPERVVATALVLAASLFAVGYAIAGLRGSRWPAFNRKVTFWTIPLTGLIALALLTPISNPYKLSVTSQLARLESGQTSIDDFDFGILKFVWGAPGRQALEDIRAGHHLPPGTDAADRLARLDQIAHYYEWQAALTTTTAFDPDRLRDKILLLPAGATFPEDFAARLNADIGPADRSCLSEPANQCALLIGDIIGDDEPEIILARRDRDHTHISFAAYHLLPDRGWQLFHYDFAPAPNAHAVWQAIEQGDIGYVQPSHKAVTLGQTFTLFDFAPQPPLKKHPVSERPKPTPADR